MEASMVREQRWAEQEEAAGALERNSEKGSRKTRTKQVVAKQDKAVVARHADGADVGPPNIKEEGHRRSLSKSKRSGSQPASVTPITILINNFGYASDSAGAAGYMTTTDYESEVEFRPFPTYFSSEPESSADYNSDGPFEDLFVSTPTKSKQKNTHLVVLVHGLIGGNTPK
jgi:hypothetical protein